MFLIETLVYLLALIFSGFLLYKSSLEPKTYRVLVWAFLLRVLLMFSDFMQVFAIPGSGADTESFHEIAVSNQSVNSNNWEILTFYSTFLTILYSLTDCNRLFAQYLNVLMGMTTLVYLNKTLVILSVDIKRRLEILKIAAFMPNLIIFSSILLREAWAEMFVMMSLYFFVHWFVYTGKSSSIIKSLLCVLLASVMHAGCFFLAIGYIVCIITYDRKTVCIRVSKHSITAICVAGVFVLFVFANANFLLSRFGSLEGKAISEILVDLYSSPVEAESAYLQWIDVSSPLQGLIFAPLKMFYFLYSPIPLDWRGLMDIIAFIFDSSIYIYLSYKIFRIKIPIRSERYLIRFILIAFLMATFVFAFGTIASGTAIRHRAKILTLLLVCYGLSMTYGNNNRHFKIEKSR